MGGIISKHTVDDKIDCQVWIKPYENDFIYPELEIIDISNKSNIGIALSGGGTRAATLSLGWLRALHELGFLVKARYISSISGGTWVHGPLTYISSGQSPTTIHKYLGSRLEPHECSIKNLKSSVLASEYGEMLLRSNFIPTMLEELGNRFRVDSLNTNSIDFWSKTVARCFYTDVQPNGSCHHRILPTLSAKKKPSLHELATNVCTVRDIKTFPFPIMNGSLVLNDKDRYAIPVEFTPMYYGISPKVTLSTGECIGGSLIEPIGFTSKISRTEIEEEMNKHNINHHKHRINMNIPKPKSVIGITEISGISSQNLAQTLGATLSDFQYKMLDFPDFPYWTPDTGHSGVGKFVDGGFIDNTGVLALLRRDCTFIVACMASNMSVVASDEECCDANVHALGGFANLFGVQKSKQGSVSESTDTKINLESHVFPSDQWEVLLRGLRDKFNRGKPTVYRMKLDVLRNDLISVRGGYKTTVVFCVSDHCQEFINALPDDTKKQLQEDNDPDKAFVDMTDKEFSYGIRRANLRKFPLYPVGWLAYEDVTIGLLSQLATWQIYESKELLHSSY